MKRSGFILVAGVFACRALAADATTPVDYTQRNTPYAPGASQVAPARQTPQSNAAVQDKRLPTATVEKQIAPLAGQRARIGVSETREKNVIEKNSHRPAVIEHRTSGFNQKAAPFSTGGNSSKPPMVAKYQDSLTAANVVKTSKLSALDGATTAKINRFVFRKNPPDPSLGTSGAGVTPAAGGARVTK